ncbi:hypothetical protein GRF29_69g2260228 [Pseudopithomyces chartarum]|uniref:Uncharacterized protein n=1 Tax=Pseudopithomyces chartarum TaxID=1892770 RepID=A0AAN6LYN2_9PLEO|nr:hypothetical protein GRF29_69g2260228 [Pseudopithomyces chartarum]
MTETWKKKQLEWLAIGHEVRRRELDQSVKFEKCPAPASSQLALLQIFMDTLDGNTTPGIAAKQVSDWVLSIPDDDICYDIHRAYANMMGVLISATSQLSFQAHLEILAEFTIELARQPDAYNNKDTPLIFESGSVVVLPGERIVMPCISGGALWSGLPDFAFRMMDDLDRGPPNFFPLFIPGREDQHQIDCQAEENYTNISTFAALIAGKNPPNDFPLRSCLDCALKVFKFLECGPDTERGKWSHLAVRAAAAWLVIAGDKLLHSSPASTVVGNCSDSPWEAQNSHHIVNIERLRFWGERFQYFRESGKLISQQAVDSTYDATVVIESLITRHGQRAINGRGSLNQ